MAIYSKSTQYAIRALIELAQAGDGAHVRTVDIAATSDVPPQFLSKIVQALTRAGLVQSLRGRSGGIRLGRPADQIILEDIVTAVDGKDPTRDCALGLYICSDLAPCPIHNAWKRVRESLVQELHEQTLAALVTTMKAKQKLLRRRDAARRAAKRRKGRKKPVQRTRRRRPTGQARGA